MISSGTKVLGKTARSMVNEIKEYVTGEEVGTIHVYGMADSRNIAAGGSEIDADSSQVADEMDK